MWSKDRAEKVLDKILGNVDVCITNASQMRDFYGIAEQGGGCGCVHAAAYLKERYGIGHTAFTYRETDKAGRESIYACVSDGKSEWISDRYAVGTIGRIGGGDAFAAGLIYKLRQGAGGQEAINFAAAASCLKHSVEGDFCLVSRSEVEELARGEDFFGVKR